MSDDALVCPDCGGFIGLEPGDDRVPCKCFVDKPKDAAPAATPSTTLRPAIARLMAQSANAGRMKAGTLDQSEDELPSATKPGAKPSVAAMAPAAEVETSDSKTVDLNADSAAPAVVPEKRCRVCGKDLAGHRRIKDSLGYICRDCVKAEAPPEDPDRRPCRECKRMIKPGGFVPYNGKMICRSCFADHMELDKYKKAAPSSQKFDQQEKKKLTRLLILAGILFALMLLSAYRTFFAHH